jgi:hypothetical protein
MIDCFAFRFPESPSEKRRSVAIFFPLQISFDSVIKSLKNEVENELTPKNVYILHFNNNSKFINATTPSFNSEFESLVGDPEDKLKILMIDRQGNFKEESSNTAIHGTLRKAILHHGMGSIFKKRKGLISSSTSYHFVKPSGDHCDKFIRASNLLVSGAEVSFLAISLLPFLENNLRRVYVDTSSISYLISTALEISGRYTGKMPIVESFESYTVLSRRYDFVESPESLVIISATTSGSLGKSIASNSSFEKRQIITLFHSCTLEDQVGIYDISDAMGLNISSWSESTCKFCLSGSMRIRIVGDQFLPETPHHETLLIRKTDFNKDREKFFKEFATTEILGWNDSSGTQIDSNEHFYINVEKLFKSGETLIYQDLAKKMKRHIARDVNTIISLDDKGSQALSDAMKTILGGEANSYNWKKLKEIDQTIINSAKSVIVVAGAITSGRKLLDASRKLRGINKDSFITYIIGFSKLPNKESLDQLARDLEMGGHQVVVLRKSPMPRMRESEVTAWDLEKNKLSLFNDDILSDRLDKLPKVLQNRLKLLLDTNGTPNALFLEKHDGIPLALRPTFAFWSTIGIDTTKATQADVYWTIQSVLHDLRGKPIEGLSSIYHSTLISPASFDRYNDGVIQACLLRAAKPTELNYSIDDDCSRKMADVVISIIKNHKTDQGEAALEFLMAIWIGRLKLNKEHLIEISQQVRENFAAPVKFLLKQIGIDTV